MVSEAARVAIVILVLALTTVGATWGYTAYRGPLTDDPPPYVQESGIFLVTYVLASQQMALDAAAFRPDGTVTYPNITVPWQNVTTLEVILQVTMGGPTINDHYDVNITDPTGASKTGGHSVDTVAAYGHSRSDSVVTWTRRAQPTAESYHTHDRDEALRWSSENRTDASANGSWSATIRMSQPLIGRAGNASLVLQFTYYEAVVLPKTRVTSSAPATTPAARAETDTVSAPPPAPHFEGLPRTFITPGSVDAAVDRGRTAHRPL